MARGRYLVLEGGEAVGKTTQASRLATRLESIGISVQLIREPGGDPFAEAGRALLLGELDREPQTEVLLFNALRAQVLLSKVCPSLERGAWVISDRSRLSTITYQGHGHGVDLDWTRTVCGTVAGLCQPDLEVVLHVDADTARARRDHRGTTDRFEQLDEGFHQRVVDGYLVEADHEGLPLVDATGTMAEVEARIWSVVAPLVGER